MRNREVIDAISEKIAAKLSEAVGHTIPAVTTAQLEASPADARLGTLYMSHLTADALTALDYHDGHSFSGGAGKPDNVFRAMDLLSEYIWRSSQPIEGGDRAPEPGRGYDRPDEGPISASESRTREEEWVLERIHPSYLPDTQDGTERTAERIEETERALAAAWDWTEETTPLLRDVAEQSRARFAERFAPADFEPTGTGAEAVAERRLAGWAALRDMRDALVRQALADGVTKSRIQQITGISRSTIDRIPGVGSTSA
ncbi:hypothetical protein AB0L71_28290 [Streptomyces sp. NPDC052052]|uniref:hypothetical protein n=1 Tax=Streptomyces sp. NPDC052052 TaxID=3154756 RepID=UPI00343C7594